MVKSEAWALRELERLGYQDFKNVTLKEFRDAHGNVHKVIVKIDESKPAQFRTPWMEFPDPRRTLRYG